MTPMFLVAAGFSFVRVLRVIFFDYDLVDSVRDWCADWFYAANLIPPLSVHSGSGPLVNDRWEKNPVMATELQAIKPFLERICTLKQQGLTYFGIISSFLRR